MKIKILATTLLTLNLAACEKQLEETTLKDTFAELEKSDAVIGGYLDKLDSSTTPLDEKKQILCKEYPAEFKNNYVPALLRLEDNQYTIEELDADINRVLKAHKKKLNISC